MHHEPLVTGLTAVVNTFGGDATNKAAPGGATRKARREARAFPATPRDPVALRDDIALEFTDAKYLWTGDITPEMYDLFCTFTDPTLSFVGLDTFTKNLENLQPILRRLVRDADVELYSCRLLAPADAEDAARAREGSGDDDEEVVGGNRSGESVEGGGGGSRRGLPSGGGVGGEKGQVQATWRMTGNLRLPWKPRIDLRGRTTFTFKDWGGSRGCLITAYQEEWELSAAEAVSQLVRPFRW